MSRDREPDILVAGLSVWFDNYQFADARQYDDANWLNTRATFRGDGSTVRLASPCARTDELRDWLEALARFEKGDVHVASLNPMEPYLQMNLTRDRERNRVVLDVRITPDNATEFHHFVIPLDAASLSRLAESVGAVTRRFPVRG